MQFEANSSAQARSLDHDYLQYAAAAFGQFSQEGFGSATGRDAPVCGLVANCDRLDPTAAPHGLLQILTFSARLREDVFLKECKRENVKGPKEASGQQQV